MASRITTSKSNFLGAVCKAPVNCQKPKMPGLQTILFTVHLSTSGNDPVCGQYVQAIKDIKITEFLDKTTFWYLPIRLQGITLHKMVIFTVTTIKNSKPPKNSFHFLMQSNQKSRLHQVSVSKQYD